MKKNLHVLILLLFTCSLANAQYFEKVTGKPPANNFAKGYSASWNDYNNDGLDDLIQTDNNKKNTLFKNMGNGVFQKDTLNPIYTTSSVNTMSSCWGDYNNDGNLDLLLVNNMNSGAANHHNYLFRNDGQGMWTLITDSPVYTNHGSAIGASMADYDNDGFLDIYIVNTDTVNFLFHNNGNGTFTRNYTAAGSIVTDIAHHWTAVWADYDNDGWQDCYVVNYFATLPGENNALYHNNHDGTFSKDPSLSVNNDGATDQTASWGDYDNDGYLDLYTAAYTSTGGYSTHNYLYHNNGDGTFTFMSGLQPSIDGNQSFGSGWLDFNNDGRLDLVVANNKSTDRHNYLYRNDGNGVFTNQTTEPVVTDLLRSMGVSISDYDNNGYPDIYIDSWSSTTEPGMYRNKGGNNNWVQFKLEGTVSNRSGIGARITLWTGGQKQIREVASSTGQYCSSSFVQTIGIGTATTVDSVVIRWPSGTIQHLCNPAINQKYLVTESMQLTGNDILTFVLPTQTGPAVIDPVNHTVSCEVTASTNLTNLSPVITVSPGGSVIPGSGTPQNFSNGAVIYKVFADNCIAQNWLVSVTNACQAPGAATIVNGPATVIQGQTSVVYGIDPIAGATGYAWVLPNGASITSGDNTNSITVSFTGPPISGNITVKGTNACGIGAESPALYIKVVATSTSVENLTVADGQTQCMDAVQTITVAGSGTFSILAGGNVTMIAGQNIIYLPGASVEQGGYLYAYITENGQYCMTPLNPLVSSPVKEGKETAILTETDDHSLMKVYPNPSTGNITLSIEGITNLEPVKVNIVGMNGVAILTSVFTGNGDHAITISNAVPGMYFMHIVSGTRTRVLKIIKL
ncbi:MAG: FG-GAP-like repeat-containing protein [Bacteroidetes bacterium]|nr:FG-GAP-like repeat-containing protein [Bacteroidota bacterium]